MARTEVTTQDVTLTGTVLALAEPTVDGDVIDSGRVALIVENTTASAVTVTVRATATVDGLEVADAVISVAAGDTVAVGPFRKSTFGRDTGETFAGQIHVDYSAQTGVLRTVVGL